MSDNLEHIATEDSLKASHRFLEIANRHSAMKPLLDEFVQEIGSLTGCQAVGIRILGEDGCIPYKSFKGFSRAFYDSESCLDVSSGRGMCVNVITGTDTNPPI